MSGAFLYFHQMVELWSRFMTMRHFLGQKWPNYPWRTFFQKSHLHNFCTLLGLFQCQIKKKKCLVWIEICVQCIIFGPKMTHLPWRIFFSEKPLQYFSCTSWPPFTVQNFEKIYRMDPELWQHVIFGPKLVQLPYMRIFFRISIEYQWIYI